MKPSFTKMPIAADILKLKADGQVNGTKAIVGRVRIHEFGKEPVVWMTLEDATEKMETDDGLAVSKWPDLDYSIKVGMQEVR